MFSCTLPKVFLQTAVPSGGGCSSRLSAFGSRLSDVVLGSQFARGTAMFRKNFSQLATFASLVTSAVLLTGQQPTGGPYTAEQATAGKAAYEASCAACHGSDLMGAPPLAGEGFIGGWRTRTTRDMYGLIRTT